MVDRQETLGKVVRQERQTGQSMECIRHGTDRNFYMSALEAKEYGIVDEVVSAAEK